MAINVIKIINLWVLMIKMKKFFVELIGTFFLVFTIGVSGNVWAIATVLMAMIYMGGYISGAHYNPAVTVGFIMRGTITVKEGLVYWIAQFSGALIGGLLDNRNTKINWNYRGDVSTGYCLGIVIHIGNDVGHFECGYLTKI